METTVSETRSQQPQPTTGSSTQSQSARSQSHLEKTSDHPIVSETGSKQQQLTTGSLTQSLPAKSQSHSEKASDHNEQIAEISSSFRMSQLQRSTTTYSAHKGTALTSPRKSIAESRLKETEKRSITAGLETNQYPSVSKLQSSGLCISRGKDFIVFCVKSTKQQILKTKSLSLL